jgi:hypothetical protein
VPVPPVPVPLVPVPPVPVPPVPGLLCLGLLCLGLLCLGLLCRVRRPQGGDLICDPQPGVFGVAFASVRRIGGDNLGQSRDRDSLGSGIVVQIAGDSGIAHVEQGHCICLACRGQADRILKRIACHGRYLPVRAVG